MRNIISLDLIAGTAIALFAAGPAIAGSPVTPAPALGLGIGALVLIGAGYRTLKRRIDRD